MYRIEPCNNCTEGICSTCHGTGFEQIKLDGCYEPKTYHDSEEFILCNCALPEANGGLGECNHCAGTGEVKIHVADEKTDIQLDFSGNENEYELEM